ncbi:MAG: hypothetical protein HY754_04600 [Nitrospirae bacterium]|nr:hypothetical protein [Nitrospirota bacterium]
MSYFKDKADTQKQCFNRQKQFATSNVNYIEIICNGFCPECKQMTYCLVYQDMEDEWNLIYS